MVVKTLGYPGMKGLKNFNYNISKIIGTDMFCYLNIEKSFEEVIKPIRVKLLIYIWNLGYCFSGGLGLILI